MRIIEILSSLTMKGLMIGSPPSSLSNCLIALGIFPTLQLKIPLKMDSLWTIPMMMTSLMTTLAPIMILHMSFHLLPQELSMSITSLKFPMPLITLNRLAQLKGDITANVITSSKVLNQYNYDTYFTSLYFLMALENIRIQEERLNNCHF